MDNTTDNGRTRDEVKDETTSQYTRRRDNRDFVMNVTVEMRCSFKLLFIANSSAADNEMTCLDCRSNLQPISTPANFNLETFGQ